MADAQIHIFSAATLVPLDEAVQLGHSKLDRTKRCCSVHDPTNHRACSAVLPSVQGNTDTALALNEPRVLAEEH